jgi:beta-hydroxylase
LNPTLRKIVLKGGRRIIQQLQKLMGRYSLIGDHAFFAPEQFPWVAELEANTPVIREELDNVLAHHEDLPNYQDISPDQKHLAKDNSWKTFFFFAYGIEAPGNCQRCPRTAGLIQKVPGAKTAFFSILAPHTHIPPHCGPYKGVIRYHLGLIVPKPETSCRLRIEDTVRNWHEGKSLVFDDTYRHEAWNDSDETRVVLFMDVVRPLPFPISLLNSLIIKSIAASPFIRDAKKNHEKWEQRMSELWN